MVKRLRAAGKDIHFVDQFGPLNASYSHCMKLDHIHPNAAGNLLIATQWFAAIEQLAKPTP